MIKKIRLLFSAFIILILPSFFVFRLLNLLGHRVSKGCRFGFSLVFVNKIIMDSGAKVGHFNLIAVNHLFMRSNSYLGRGNIVYGPISIMFAERSAIGNNNKIARAGIGVTFGKSKLQLGTLAKITSNHVVDCTQSISIGAYSTIAGQGTQIWTHGYIHETVGADRYRIDGRVRIGSNVYIGSRCIISMGVQIYDRIIVGAGATVARDLIEEGLYVSSTLRKLPRPIQPDQREDLQKVTDSSLCERVYVKKNR